MDGGWCFFSSFPAPFSKHKIHEGKFPDSIIDFSFSSPFSTFFLFLASRFSSFSETFRSLFNNRKFDDFSFSLPGFFVGQGKKQSSKGNEEKQTLPGKASKGKIFLRCFNSTIGWNEFWGSCLHIVGNNKRKEVKQEAILLWNESKHVCFPE